MSDFSMQITDLLGLNRAPSPRQWGSIEATLGGAIPADYKSLIDYSGAIVIDECLSLFEPQSDDRHSDLLILIQERERAWSRLRSVGVELPERYFENGYRLLSFAAVEANYFFWREKPGESADEWGVVIVDADVEEWYEIEMSATECIYKILTGELELDPFEDLFSGPHHVTALGSFT
jgi:hypothetical protein